jgi:hypothetical protein
MDMAQKHRNAEPVPEKTGAGDAVPEADQVEKEPEQPTPPDQAPTMDDAAPVEPSGLGRVTTESLR